jgi:hypothetical protein
LCAVSHIFCSPNRTHRKHKKEKNKKTFKPNPNTYLYVILLYIATLRKKKNRKQKETSVKPTLLKINPSLSFSFSPLFHPLFTPWLPLSLSCTTTEKKDPREKEERGEEGQWVLICVLNSVPKPLLLGGRWRYQNNKNWNKMN